jgi:2-C-methyl-D-erythritol 4-phosphate cytidylyltransferase
MNYAAGQELLSDCGLIVAAGGSSSRFAQGNKLLVDLAGLPVFCHCLRAFLPLVPPGQVVLVVPAAQEEDFLAALTAADMQDRLCVVHGGDSRQASVQAGLAALPSSATLVAVQDAARPLVTAELLSRCVLSTRQVGSGVAAHRVVDTIKTATAAGLVSDTLERQRLWAAETPQVFRSDWLTQAYARVSEHNLAVTDDAEAVQLAGYPVQLVESRQANVKITHGADLILAASILAQRYAGAGETEAH